MNHKSSAVIDPPVDDAVVTSAVLPLARVEGKGSRSAWDGLRLGIGYVALAATSFAISVVAIPMRLLLPKLIRRRWGRRMVSRVFRSFLHLLELMGACRFDLSELDSLRGEPAMIIAPNHPSLLDAIIVISRLPNVGCVMKSEIVNSLFFGVGARLVDYICNTPLRNMVQLAEADLAKGSHLLLFPEGTRTSRFPVGSIQGTTGLIAKHAGAPVQTVFIETNSAFLGKGWPILKVPTMPVIYRVRLGTRFEPPENVGKFALELEQYFHSQLAEAELPPFAAGPR